MKLVNLFFSLNLSTKLVGQFVTVLVENGFARFRVSVLVRQSVIRAGSRLHGLAHCDELVEMNSVSGRHW
jgi:hypothetical protein